MDKYITEEKTQMANKHMKICSASLIKITVRNHFMSICLENIKKPQNMQLVRLRNNDNPCRLLVELQIGTFSLEHHAALSTKVEYVIPETWQFSY